MFPGVNSVTVMMGLDTDGGCGFLWVAAAAAAAAPAAAVLPARPTVGVLIFLRP